MDIPAALTLVTIVACLVGMVATRISPDLILLSGVVFLAAIQIITPEAALAGFANTGMLTVAALFVVAEGLHRTGVLVPVVGRVLGQSGGARRATLRMSGPVLGLSAFLNNTTIVASLVQPLEDWCRRNNISPSALLMPLSYLSIMGGTITLIGTSTNLVVAGLVTEAAPQVEGLEPLKLFDITWVGLPAAIAGALVLVVFSSWLFPTREATVERRAKRYLHELRIPQGSRFIGLTPKAAGLHDISGSVLLTVFRGDEALGSDTEEPLQEDDRVLARADLDCALDAQENPDLQTAPEFFPREKQNRDGRVVVEAVLSTRSSLVDRPISSGTLYRRYGAVVIAVARVGAAPRVRMSDVELRPGDVLLMEVLPEAIRSARARADFVLVSELDAGQPRRADRAIVSAVILLGLVVIMATGMLPTVVAAFLAAGAMIASGCCTSQEARRAVDLQVLVAISASFGLGAAMQATGLDDLLATGMMNTVASRPITTLVAMYVITTLLTEAVTNNAAAVLMFPVALALASQQEVSPMPYVIVVMMAASASFLSPIGYQTNLMVMEPGGYRGLDYLRAGLPLSLCVGAVTVVMTSLVYPF